MKQTYIEGLLQVPIGSAVELDCWLKERRNSGSICFLDLVDSTGQIQAVAEQRQLDSLFERITRIPLESAIHVSGVIASNLSANKPREISVKSVSVIGEASHQITPRPRSDFDVFDPKMAKQLLDNRHLYLKNPKIMAILKFRSLMMSSVRRWFEERGFTEIDAPILTPVPLYDDRTAMNLDVDGQNVFLTQCVGYYLEAAVHAFERVYNMGPSFRGEESRSPRHLMEYHHIKAEIAFCDLEGIIRTVEDLISHVSQMATQHLPITRILETDLCLDGLRTPFPRISYEEALVQLKKKGIDVEFGRGIGGHEEEALSSLFDTPFWITGIPRLIEPFPYCIDPMDPRITRVADLVASRGRGELLGVAEKIHDCTMLDERLAEKNKLADPRYQWIREVHQAGCVPHAAFGMGVERMIRWILGIPHVRDAIPFPRIFRRTVYP